MNPVQKLYLKVFLLTGIPFATFTSVYDFIGTNEWNPIKFLISFIVFGLIMSFTLVSLHIAKLEEMGIREATPENLAVKQTRSVKTPLEMDEVFQKICSDVRTSKMNVQQRGDVIELTTRFSWWSWGEKIRIYLKEKHQNGYDYQISSTSRLKTTLVDFGKNLENVISVEKAIKG